MVRNQVSVRSQSLDSHKLKTYDGTKNLFVLFRLTGHVMPDRYKALYFVYSLIFNFMAIVVTPILFTLGYFTGTEPMQFNHFLTSLQMCISTYTCSIKFCAVIYMQPYLLKFKNILDRLDARITHAEEILEAHRAIRFGNRALILFTISYYTYSSYNLLSSLCVGRPPYEFYNPYLDWRKSTTNLIVASALEYLLSNAVIAQQLINDTYAVIYTVILHSHLKILILRVLRIGTDPKCTQDDNTKELVGCIRDHKNIIELIETIKPVISATYFTQFLTTAICLGASFINISIANDKSTLCGSVVYATLTAIQILPICYMTNTLADENDRLSESIFQMNWIDQSLELRRMCLFFMHRSQQPIIFDAGKMFEISLNTFVSIIQFSFSVYTLLNSMGFAERFN